MEKTGLLSISDFAKYSRTTRDTLIHYDKTGLLSPISRDENNYRRYSIAQVGSVNMIHTLQEMGMSLEEIKSVQVNRNPQIIEDLLTRQIENIDSKIYEWNRAKKLLLTTKKIIQSTQDIDETVISMQYLPEEAIIIGDVNDYSGGRDDYDALVSFYKTAYEKYPELDMNYPVWGVFSEKQIKQCSYTWPERYFFYNPEGLDRKPASMYVIGYTRGRYGQSNELFGRLLNFIHHNNLEICGDSYKEYPLNEICISDETDYLIKVMIPVSSDNN